MFRKINNKLLVVIFGILLVIVVIVKLVDSRKGNRTFKSDLVEVNAADVTAIELFPKVANGTLIKLFKENDVWQLESEGKRYNADQSAAASMINELNQMKPKSVVATKKDRWKQFEVTDSLATRVKLLKDGDVLADVMLGKFSFSQPQTMTSYVRLNDDNEVYGVDGMLGMSFNRNVNSFRDKTVIKSNKTDWIKLTFTYPSDSSFVLEKKGEKWMVGEMKTDSAALVKYFNSIAHLTGTKFANSKPVGPPTHSLKIEGNNGMSPLEISGYFTDKDNFVLASNQNSNTYFNNPKTARKVFVPVMKLIQTR